MPRSMSFPWYKRNDYGNDIVQTWLYVLVPHGKQKHELLDMLLQSPNELHGNGI